MVKENRKVWKSNYFAKMERMLMEYDRCFVVQVDNVRSKQMQSIRIALRGSAEMLMGKNTMMRRVVQSVIHKKPSVEVLLNCLKGNVGFVFTHGDLNDIKEVILANVVAAPAKAGAIAPCDVAVPAQNTGLGPEKTNFFQALSIPTKITRGTIEILNEMHLVTKDMKVGASEATLLGMLKIMPFSYGLIISQVYDSGSVYAPEVLDITPDTILSRFREGTRKVAAVSLALDYPTAASIPHSLANAFKNMLAVSLATEYTFPEAQMYKDYLADPSKFACAAAPAAGAGKKEEAAAKAPEPEDDESDDEPMFDLFG